MHEMTHVPADVISDSYGARSAQSHESIQTRCSLHPKACDARLQRSVMIPAPRIGHIVIPQAPLNIPAIHHRSTPPVEDSPFNSIAEDLRNRIIDWKGHALSGLGPLQMYDMLSVRREALVQEFFVHRFKEAIISVVEEKNDRLAGSCRHQHSMMNRLLPQGLATSPTRAYCISEVASLFDISIVSLRKRGNELHH